MPYTWPPPNLSTAGPENFEAFDFQASNDQSGLHLVGDDALKNYRSSTPDGWNRAVPLFDKLYALEQEATREQREFEQSSAREAMAFEADQAKINRDFQQSSAREAMAFEADQAKINRDFQAEMSNTAYQRAVADLKKAGLNPALAYQQGGSATTSGATASGATASGSSASGRSATGAKANLPGNVLANIVSSYINQSTQLTSSSISAIGNLLGSVISKLG